MPRPPKADRESLRAVRPTGSRGGLLAMPGVGSSVGVGPTAAQIGRPEIQRSEGEENGEKNGSAVVVLRFTSELMRYARPTDWAGFRTLAQTMKATAVALSQGPYKQAVLTAMGHPYAKNPNDADRVARLRKSGHNVPRFQPGKAIGHIRGISGSVTTLSVVNIQTGTFAESWDVQVVIDAGGVSVILSNSAEYAIYLLEGTDKMIGHGPFEYAPRLLLPQYNAEWARVMTLAWSRQPQIVRAARRA